MTEDNPPIEQRKVKLVPHNPDWSKLAEKESDRILEILPIPVINIYHIGSTAIPGIKAKPILDFVLEVENIDALEAHSDHLTQIGYQAKGERGISGRRFFTKDTDGSRSHHLHAFQQGHPEIKRHLVFRDYLRAHPQAAQEYQQLKERLAKRYPERSGNYTEAKTDFILSMDEVARYWHEQKNKK